MRKIFALLLSFVLCLSVVGCGNNEETEEKPKNTIVIDNAEEKPMEGVFRYANWGDSIETVESLEPIRCVEKDERTLMYEIKLLTYDAYAFYFFGGKGLISGMYSIIDTHTNYNSYIDDFNRIDDTLKEKYGEPSISKAEWLNDLLKDDPGIALYYGDVKYFSLWSNENVQILHELSSDNFEFKHNIVYFDPNRETKTDTTGL